MLAPYWSGVLDKVVMKARQCSPRGGDLGVVTDTENGRVILTGSAVIVIRGVLNV